MPAAVAGLSPLRPSLPRACKKAPVEQPSPKKVARAVAPLDIGIVKGRKGLLKVKMGALEQDMHLMQGIVKKGT